jgi:hypothetical protein
MKKKELYKTYHKVLPSAQIVFTTTEKQNGCSGITTSGDDLMGNLAGIKERFLHWSSSSSSIWSWTLNGHTWGQGVKC